MKKILSLIIVFCLLFSLSPLVNKSFANTPDISDLHRYTSINVGVETMGSDYFFIELIGEGENFAWNLIEQSSFYDTIYDSYYGDDLSALKSAFKDGFFLGLDASLKLDIFKDIKNHKELNQMRDNLETLQTTIEATRDYIQYLNRNEISSLRAMKTITYGFISDHNYLMDDQWNFIEYPFIAETTFWDLFNPANWYVRTLHSQENNVKRQENWLMVYEGSELKKCFTFTDVCMPSPEIDFGDKSMSRDNLKKLAYDLYLLYEGKEAVFYKEYAELLKKDYESSLDHYDQSLLNYYNDIDKQIENIGSIDYKIFPHQQNVPKDKKWTVNLSQQIDASSFDSSNIYIFTEDSKLLNNLDIKLVNDGKSIEIANPTDYEPEKTYKLYIDKIIYSNDGHILKEPIQMKFTIKREEIVEEEKEPEEPIEQRISMKVDQPIVDSAGNVYYLQGELYNERYSTRDRKRFLGKEIISKDAAGNERWRYTVLDDQLDGPIGMGDDDVLYIKGKNHLYAITDGALKWKVEIPETIHYIPFEHNGTVYVFNSRIDFTEEDHNKGTKMYAINPETGNILREGKYLKFGNYANPAVHNNTVYISDGITFAIDLNTFRVKWKYSGNLAMKSSPLIDKDGNIIVKDGYDLVKLDSNGKLISEFKNDWLSESNKKGIKLGDNITVGSNGNVYVLGTQLVVLDSNLKYQWHFVFKDHFYKKYRYLSMSGINKPVVDPAGNITVITSNFRGASYLPQISFEKDTLYYPPQNEPTNDSFLLKFNNIGNLMSEKKLDGLYTSPVISPQGTIYVGGTRLFKID